MEIADKFLPIGTIVKVKNLDREVMISCYCIVSKLDMAKKRKPEIREYGGCYYPDGFIRTDRIIAFNHDQIEKVIYMGYQTDESKENSDKYNKILEKSLNLLENVEDNPEESSKINDGPVIPIDENEE